MGLNTYPYNPFPASTDKLDEAHNEQIQEEVDQLKSGLTNVRDDFTDVVGWDKRKNLYNGSVSVDGAFATAYKLPSGLTTITISAKKTSDCPQINTLIYDNEGNIIVNYTKLIDASNTSGHVTVTLNKQGYIALYPISDGASNINKVFDIQVEKGATATSYEPYHPVIGDAVQLNTQDLTTPSRTANIAISTSSDSTDVSQYSIALYVDCDLKPNTTYTLSFDGTNGARYYTNENLFASQSTVTVGSDRAVLTVTTKSTISKDGNKYTSGKGWIILKNSITEPAGHAFTDVQFEIGSSATPYSVYTPSVESRIEAVESGVTNLKTTFKAEGSATDLSLWANDSGVVVLSTYIAALNKRVGFKRDADGTISSYES